MKQETKDWWKCQWAAIWRWLACMGAAAVLIGGAMLIF